MSNVLVILCVALVVACVIAKESSRRNVGRLQGELDTLKREEQVAEYEREQYEAVLAMAEETELELTNDSVQLTSQLGELQTQIVEEEARSKHASTPEEEQEE